jgi:hypothetical protein
MNPSTNTKSRADSAQQFARGFAFVFPAIQPNESGRFRLHVEFWTHQSEDDWVTEFDSETTMEGAELVSFCRFLGSCLMGLRPQQWRCLHQKQDCVRVTT